MALPERRLAEIADLVIWYPQFGDDFEAARPGLRQAALDSMACMFTDCIWQEACNLLLAHVHATAHLLISNQKVAGSDGGKTGDDREVASMSMGPVSKSWVTAGNAGSASDQWWSTTPAGRAFLDLRDALGPVPVAPGGGCDDVAIGGCFGC